MEHQITVIWKNWETVCGEAELSDTDRQLLWGRQFLNDLAFEGLGDQLTEVVNVLPHANPG